MLYVECDSDEVLVRHVTGLPRKGIRHEAGKGNVCNRLRRRTNSVGLVDEDPGKSQPRYLGELIARSGASQHGLKLLLDTGRDNRVVLVCPDLENWILAAASECGVRVQDYGLPDDVRHMKSAIELNVEKLRTLLRALDGAGSRRLTELARLLA